MHHLLSGTITIAIIVVASLTLAGDEPAAGPSSREARDALAKLEAAQKKAKADYDRAVKVAADTAIKELETAKAAAMKRQDLDEANRVQSAIDSVRLAGSKRFTISAKKPWQATLTVEKGSRMSIEATGKWCFFVEDRARATVTADGGERDGKRYGVLVAKIDDGQPFEIGGSKTFVASESGTLFLQMQDSGYKDNDGEIAVEIRSAP